MLDGVGERRAVGLVPALTWQELDANQFADGVWEARSPRNGDIRLDDDFVITRESWNNAATGDQTCWHEAQHAVLAQRGHMVATAQPGDDDIHHAYMVYYAERGVAAFRETLIPLENELERINANPPTRPLNPSEERQFWGQVSLLWRLLLSRWAGVRQLTSDEFNQYYNATGIRLPDPQDLAAAYRQGRYLRRQGIVPPAWVFADSGDAPTFIDVRESGQPVVTTGCDYQVTLDVQGILHGHRTVISRPDRGTLRVRIEEPAPSASFSVTSHGGADLVHGVANQSTWQHDLSARVTPSTEPFVVLLRADDPQKAQGQELHLLVEYSGYRDPHHPERNLAPCEARLILPLRALKLKVSGPASVDAKEPLALSVQAVNDLGQPATPDPARKPRFRWSVLAPNDHEGERIDVAPRPPGSYTIPVALWVESGGREVKVAEASLRVQVTGRAASDPRIEAEARHRWLQEVELYLKELLLLDAEAIRVLQRTCGDNHARQLTAKHGDKYKGLSKEGAAHALAQDVLAEQARLGCMRLPTQEHQQHQQDLKTSIQALEDSRLAGEAWKEYAGLKDYQGYLAGVDKLKARFRVPVPDPLSKPAGLPWSYSLACSSAQGGVASQVMVSLKTQKKTIKPGERCLLTAEASGGNPPYTYRWSLDPAADGPTFTFSSLSAGEREVTVTAVDSAGNEGRAQLRLSVSSVTCKVSAPATTVALGKSLRLQAAVLEEGQPAGQGYVFRWEPRQEVDFDRLDSEEAGVTARFNRPGPVDVWVVVLQMADSGELVTVATSDSIRIEVNTPQAEIDLFPAEPLVGQVVQARLRVDSGTGKPRDEAAGPESLTSVGSEGLPDSGAPVKVRWLPLPEPAVLLGESQDGLEITFYLKQAQRPVEVQALILSEDGDDLGQARATLSARPYQVSVAGPQTQGAKPRVFKAGVGLVEVEGQLAVGQQLGFQAVVSPTPEKPPLRYRWSSSEGCTLSNPAVSEPNVTCSAPGAYELAVEVRDSREVVLGQASINFSVTLASMDGGSGARTGALLEEARQLTAAGQYAPAADKVLEAEQQDARAAAPVRSEVAQAAKARAWELLGAQPEPDVDGAIELLGLALKLAPSDKDAREKLAQAQQAKASYARLRALMQTLKGQVVQKNVAESYRTLQAMYANQQGLRGSPGILAEADKLYHGLEADMNAWVASRRSASDEHAKKRRWAQQAQVCEEALGWGQLTEVDRKGFETSLASARRYLAEQETARRTYEELRASWEAGQLAEPHKHSGQIRFDLMPEGDLIVAPMAGLRNALTQNLQPALPADGTTTDKRRPTVMGAFGVAVERDSVRMLLDGQDVTSRSLLTLDTARYEPLADLAAGAHQVMLVADVAGGGKVQRVWSFTVSGPTAADAAKVRRLADEARAYLEAGRTDQAVEAYTRLLELDPANAADYHNKRGVARAQGGDDAGAMKDYERAIELDPELARAYNNRGNAKRRQGDAPGAVADLTKAVDLDPADPKAPYNLGMAKEVLGDVQGAMEAYTMAIGRDPTFAKAYTNRGNLLQNQGASRQALADFEQAVRLSPADASCWRNRGVARSHLGDLEGAIADFERALALNPGYEAARKSLEAARKLLTVQQAPPPAPPLSVRVEPTRIRASLGQWVVVRSEVKGGTGPYVYTWYYGNQRIDVSADSAGVSTEATTSTTITVVVTDASGQQARASCPVEVAAAPAPPPPPAEDGPGGGPWAGFWYSNVWGIWVLEQRGNTVVGTAHRESPPRRMTLQVSGNTATGEMGGEKVRVRMLQGGQRFEGEIWRSNHWMQGWYGDRLTRQQYIEHHRPGETPIFKP